MRVGRSRSPRRHRAHRRRHRVSSRPGALLALHPRDREDWPDAVETPLDHGAAGVIWALHYLHYLHGCGAATLLRDYLVDGEVLLTRNRDWLAGEELNHERALPAWRHPDPDDGLCMRAQRAAR